MKLTAGQIKMMQEDMYADLIQILMEAKEILRISLQPIA